MNGERTTVNRRKPDERRGLLAKVHIAKKDLGLSQVEYDAILSGFKVTSSRDMTIPQLERLVRYMKHLGWTARRAKGVERGAKGSQVDALRERAAALGEGFDPKRLAGLVRKICGAERLEWCTDIGKLKRLLAVLEKIRNPKSAIRN